jgi:putative ABC transport system permease protein
MSVIWEKVRVDLWDNKIRTILAILSISAGVFAIGVTFGMADQLLSGMDQAHQSVFPSHINMFLNKRIDRDTARSLKRIEGVEDVEPSNQVAVRYKIHPEDAWETGLVVMRDDYKHQTYDVLQLKSGRWPEKNDVGIERLSSQYFKIDTGDQVIFEVGNTQRSLSVIGKVRHPFVLPPQFGGIAYFFMDGQGLELFNVPDGEFGQLLIRVKPYSADYAKEVATRIKDRLAKEGVGVAATVYQDPEKHWGRMFVEGITVVLQMLALVSLFMSVILVLNTLTALITQQTSQIGIIKSIGGTTGTIVKVYLSGVLVYGLLAFIISLPLAAFLAFGLSSWFLNLFNIDYEVFRVSSQAIIWQVLAAIVVPLLAALWPILKGATITVREAIASYGLGGDFGSSWLDRMVERIGERLLSSPYAIALGNLFRRKGRLILTQVVLVTAGTMFLVVMSLSASINLTLDHEFGRRNYDTTVYFQDNERIDRAVPLAESLNGVEKAEIWFVQPASILREGQRTKEAGIGGQINGVPLGNDMYRPLMVAGRWLQPGDGRVVVMNKQTADDNHIQLGDIVTLDLAELGKDDWQVVGLYQIVFGGGFATDTIYAPQEAVFEATKKYNKGGTMFVRMRQHGEDYVNTLTDQLKAVYKLKSMDVNYTETVNAYRESAAGQFGITTSMLLALAVVVAIVGGIGLMGALSISVVERIREIGVMRAIGAQSATIMGMFMMEGVLQGLISWAVAVPLSFAGGHPAANGLGQALFEANLDYQYNWQAVLVWLLIVTIISILASIVPARSATQISVRDSLAYT